MFGSQAAVQKAERKKEEEEKSDHMLVEMS